MKDWVPLLQTMSWVVLIAIIIVLYRQKISFLLDAISERVIQGSSLKVGPVEIGELKAELSQVRSGLDEVNEKIGELFLATMARAMFQNLKKLSEGNFGKYEMSTGLERELYHLRDIGYIEVESIKAIPKSGVNLSDHVVVKPAGREFVALRESTVRSMPPPN